MQEWMWLIALCLLLLVLYLLALLKPVMQGGTRAPKASASGQLAAMPSQTLNSILTSRLAGYDIHSKSNRFLISRHGTQIAIITIDDHAVIHERIMADVLILTLPADFHMAQVDAAIEKVRHHADYRMHTKDN